jgi:drug/metabolite transporter (DMT)-like permease
MLAVVLALAAAGCYAVGWVLQQREAAAQAEQPSLSPRLLLHLLRRPLWLLGIVSMVAGNLLQAAALAVGSLTLVEPVLVLSLLFALPLGAAWSRQRLHLGEWAAAVAVSVGVALALVIGGLGGATRVGIPVHWALAGSATSLATAAIVAAGTRVEGAARATLFATAAGMLFGLQDATTKSLFEALKGAEPAAVLTSWQSYAVVLTAVYGLLLSQDAYKSAALPASLPALTVGEPIVGVAVGVAVLGEHVNTSGPALVGELAALVLMVWGTHALAKSPLVLAEQREPEHEPVGRRQYS